MTTQEYASKAWKEITKDDAYDGNAEFIIAKYISLALAEEREICAEIADQTAWLNQSKPGLDLSLAETSCKCIATTIRKRMP